VIITRLDGQWYPLTGPSDQFIVTPNLVVVRQGGVIKAMNWSVGTWFVPATNAAVDVKASSNYIAWKDSYGNLMAREGAGDGGTLQNTSIDQFDVTPYMVVFRQGGVIKAKAWAVGSWKTPATNAAVDMKAAGNFIAWTDTFGNLQGREGAGDGGYTQTSAGAQFEVTPQLLVVRHGGAIDAKAWAIGAWKQPATNSTVDIRAAGNRIAWLDSFGTLWAREGAWDGGGLNEQSNITQYVLSNYGTD
jgi:hypothetical protein